MLLSARAAAAARLAGACGGGGGGACLAGTRDKAKAAALGSLRGAATGHAAAARDNGVIGVLQYQRVVPGKRAGRYIGVPDGGALADEHVATECVVGDARALLPQPCMEENGFELRRAPTAVADFADDAAVREAYYPEVEALVKEALPGVERVVVFDHTLRTSAGAAGLNALGDTKTAAAAVQRVHTDYTEETAPRRLAQLAEQGSYTGARLSPEDVERIKSGDFAFINVWRAWTDSGEPVRSAPLAVLDPSTVRPEEKLPYEMVYADRVGGNYALTPSPDHAWYYFPRMTRDEALVFKTYDSREKGDGVAGGVFHTAFDDPTAGPDAPPRRSVEVRAFATFAPRRTPVFFDMVHSNNAARVRLWLRLKGLDAGAVETRTITYADLQSDEFGRVNPLRKVPAFVDTRGRELFESAVILDYLEDKFEGQGEVPTFRLSTPEERAFVQLLVRVHDVYISSPNCTQPNFAHTQGAMYLAPYETEHCGAARAMDRPTRAAKLAEIWKQLGWLEAHCRGPWLAGAAVSAADMTWFPTAVFMEFMLPRVFGWPNIFYDPDHFPKLAAWYQQCMSDPTFARVHHEIWTFWEAKEKAGQFVPIVHETNDPAFKWRYP